MKPAPLSSEGPGEFDRDVLNFLPSCSQPGSCHHPIYGLDVVAIMTDMTTKTDDELRALIMAAIEELGSRRFNEGGAAMREAILRATQHPLEMMMAHTGGMANLAKSIVGSASTVTVEESTKARAPRGSVGKAIDPLLRANPGMLVPDLEAEVKRRHPEIHPKSIGNELRRFEGGKYKRDREGGYRWFLIDDQDGGQTGAEAPAADMQHKPTEGGDAQ